MKQSQIILRFLFPSCQDAAEAVHPAMRPFHYPASSLEAGFMFNPNISLNLRIFDTQMA
jgi:hypothetical protein